MQKHEAAASLARQVSDSLARMLDDGLRCPHDADRFDWSSDVLDELARAVATLAQVVDRLAGSSTPVEDDMTGGAPPTPDSIDEKARDLATAIVRQRNSLVAEGAGRRHVAPRPALSRSPMV